MTAPHADAGPAVYFVNLKDGDTVSSTFRVVFGVYGKGVAPAGTEKENTGHHHLLDRHGADSRGNGFRHPQR